MMGMEHLGNLLALGATLTAVADPHPPSREHVMKTWNERSAVPPGPLPPGAVPAEFETHRELLSSDLCDAVIVSSPNMTHADILADIFAADIHVLVEKPLCTTVEDCLKVIDLAESSSYSSVAWVGMEYRYMAPIARLMEIAASEVLGNLRMVAIREHRFPFLHKVGEWNRFNRNTGGTLVEKCCHFFDLMDAIMGARPEQVYASGGHDVNHFDETHDGQQPDILDNAYVVVDYPGSTRGMLDLCMFAEATRNQEEVVVVGDAGKAEAFVPEDIVRLGLRDEHFIGNVETEEASSGNIAFEGSHHGSSYLEMAAFFAAIDEGAQAEVTLLDGLWAVAVGVAGQMSIEEGRPVAMSEVVPEGIAEH